MSLYGKRLGFSYESRGRKVQVLSENTTPKIRSGKCVGLYGNSGQGKSTLALVLAGYLRPNYGQVFFNTQSLWNTQPRYWPVQLIYQHPVLAFDPRRKVGEVIERVPPNIIDRLNIEAEWRTHYPHELSAGQLQRVAIGRTIGDERTKVIIADEATTMVDTLTQAEIWYTLNDWKGGELSPSSPNEKSILVISHNRALLELVCDEVFQWHAFIKNGEKNEH